MEHARQRLRLMQLSSSSLPVGSFTLPEIVIFLSLVRWIVPTESRR